MKTFSKKTFGVLLLGIAIGGVAAFYFLEASQVNDVRTQAPKQIAEQSEASEASTKAINGVPMFSNLGPSPLFLSGAVRQRVFEGPILYNSHIAYSRYFAEQYGFPEQYVSDQLPEAVDYIAFDMKYAGNFSSCNIKMLIDKDGPIHVAPINVYRPFGGSSVGMMQAAQPKRSAGHGELRYQQRYRLDESEYYSSKAVQDAVHRDASLIGLDDPEVTDSGVSAVTMPVHVIKHNQFKEWSFVELGTGCVSLIQRIVAHPYVFVTMRPTGSSNEVSIRPQIMDQFINIKIPDSVINPVRADFAKITFSK